MLRWSKGVPTIENPYMIDAAVLDLPGESLPSTEMPTRRSSDKNIVAVFAALWSVAFQGICECGEFDVYAGVALRAMAGADT